MMIQDDVKTINQMDFHSAHDAADTLRAAGFREATGILGFFDRPDGVRAKINWRFRDSRYYVVFFDEPRSSGYNAVAVNKAIDSSNRAGRKIGAQEARAIHALLKGRH